MEKYKIESPLGEVRLYRMISEEVPAATGEEENIGKIFLSLSEKRDFALKTAGGITQDSAILNLAFFVSRILGYPTGEYEAQTPWGVKVFRLNRGENRYPQITEECKLLASDVLKTKDGEIRFCDALCRGSCFRLVICADVRHFDIDRAGNMLLRYKGSPISVAALSPSAEGSYHIKHKIRAKSDLETWRASIFASAAEYLFAREKTANNLKFTSPFGEVFAKRGVGGKHFFSVLDAAVSKLHSSY